MVIFDTASAIALFLNIFVSVYLLAIFLYIILSWIRVPYSLQPVQRFLYDVCEPYLALWRRLLPFLRFGPLDLTLEFVDTVDEIHPLLPDALVAGGDLAEHSVDGGPPVAVQAPSEPDMTYLDRRVIHGSSSVQMVDDDPVDQQPQ